jgi:hypothetical protein
MFSEDSVIDVNKMRQLAGGDTITVRELYSDKTAKFKELLSTEEYQAQSKLSTERALIELGKQQAELCILEKEHNDRENIRERLEKYEDFDIREFICEYLTKSDVEQKAKLFHIIEQNSFASIEIKKNRYYISRLKDKVNELTDDLTYHENEETRAIEELDQKEEEFKKKEEEYKQVKKNHSLRTTIFKMECSSRDKVIMFYRMHIMVLYALILGFLVNYQFNLVSFWQ